MPQPGFAEAALGPDRTATPMCADLPLGAARAQVHENYIIAQTEPAS